jgi:proteic killer suppression protein
MKIRNFLHKGLKKLYTDETAKGVSPDSVDKLRKMFAFLDDIEDPDELRSLPAWKAHVLMGNRKGTWSLSVTANRRLTLRVDTVEREICDVNLEDYHLEREETRHAHEEPASSRRFHSDRDY